MPLPFFTLPPTSQVAVTARPSIPIYGASALVFLPSSPGARRLLGDSMVGFVPGFGPTIASPKGRWSPDLAIFRGEGGRASLAFVGGQYRVALTSPVELVRSERGPKLRVKRFVPYVGGGVTGLLASLDASVAGEQERDVRLAASAFVGAAFGPNVFAQATYRYVPGRVAGYDFSGLQLTLGLRL